MTRYPMIQAAAPKTQPAGFELLAAPDALEIRGEAEDNKPKTFAGVVYNGGPMQLNGFYRPVVVDLAGLRVTNQSNPVFRQHDPAKIVGHTTAVPVEAQKVRVEGIISGTGDAAKEVVANARNGFPWQLSIGASVQKLVRVDDGERVTVNGKQFVGPLLIARKTTLGEVSFVPRGADSKSNVKVAAIATEPLLQGNQKMNEFEKWLKAKGFDLETLTDDVKANLQAMFDADQAKIEAEAGKGKPAEKIEAESKDDDAGQTPDIAAARADELDRIAAIEAEAKNFPAIAAKALREGWSADETKREVARETELAELRAQRPTMGPGIHVDDSKASGKILEAAIRLGSAEPSERVEGDYDEKTLEAAHKYRHIGVKELTAMCCSLDGLPVPRPGASAGDYATAIKAAFSTASLSGVLGDSANKTLMAAYKAVPMVSRQVAAKLSANDFKTHTGYRTTGDPTLTKVGPAGELKYGNLDEDSFTYSVDTYGKIFGITRQDIINDDLNAFTQIPVMLGRGAALAIENAFWTLVLANSGSFFGSGNSNYISGAGTVLQASALATAVQTIRQLTDADGKPIAITPKFLLVPPELEETADELFTSTNVVIGTSTKAKIGSANTFKNKYQPLVSPYLSNSSYTGYSATAWYLLGDPADVACFGIAYLNGAEKPIVEEADQPAEYLGKAWRGYIDFGVCQVDKRGGVMSKGAA